MKKVLTSKVKFVLVLTVILTVALVLLNSFGHGDSFPERVVQGIMTPLRTGVNGLVQQAEKLYGYVFRYEALEAELEKLRAEIAAMENDARTADALQRENQRLKELNGLKEEREDFVLVSAYIITWDSNDWTSSFTINKGTRSGIEKDIYSLGNSLLGDPGKAEEGNLHRQAAQSLQDPGIGCSLCIRDGVRHHMGLPTAQLAPGIDDSNPQSCKRATSVNTIIYFSELFCNPFHIF